MRVIFPVLAFLSFASCSLKIKTTLHEPEPVAEESLFFRSLMASIGYNLTKLDQLKADLANRGVYIQRADDEQFTQFQTTTKKHFRDIDVVIDGKYSFLSTFDKVINASTSGDRRLLTLWLNILNGTFLQNDQIKKFARAFGSDHFEEQLFHYLPHTDERMFEEWVKRLIDQKAGPLAFRWLFHIYTEYIHRREGIVSPNCLRLFAKADGSMIDSQTSFKIFSNLSYTPTLEEINSIIREGTAAPSLIESALLRIDPSKDTMRALIEGGYKREYDDMIKYNWRYKYYDLEVLASLKWGKLQHLISP